MIWQESAILESPEPNNVYRLSIGVARLSRDSAHAGFTSSLPGSQSRSALLTADSRRRGRCRRPPCGGELSFGDRASRLFGCPWNDTTRAELFRSSAPRVTLASLIFGHRHDSRSSSWQAWPAIASLRERPISKAAPCTPATCRALA